MVPLTIGLIAHIYGIHVTGRLYGLIFFWHQLVSFFGVWISGRIYDLHGDYTAVWWLGIAVGGIKRLGEFAHPRSATARRASVNISARRATHPYSCARHWSTI